MRQRDLDIEYRNFDHGPNTKGQKQNLSLRYIFSLCGHPFLIITCCQYQMAYTSERIGQKQF